MKAWVFVFVAHGISENLSLSEMNEQGKEVALISQQGRGFGGDCSLGAFRLKIQQNPFRNIRHDLKTKPLNPNRCQPITQRK